MEEWKKVKLGDVLSIKGGKRLPKGINLINVPNNHPYIRVRDLESSKYLELNSSYEYVDEKTQKLISKYTVNTGDILISIVGTIGLVGKIGKSLNNANLTENCVKLVELNGVDDDFLYYFLKSTVGQSEITKGTVGAVQAKLPIKNIQAISILLPPLNIQKQIAKLLSSLDDKIALNTRINDNLEQQAQALYKSWFVDFEPFKDGKFIDSELGKIPEGWRVGELSDIAEITMGQSPDGSSYNEAKEGIIFYQGRGEFGKRFPIPRLYTTEPKRIAESNSVLLSVRAPVGDINIASEECCIGRGLASIKSNSQNNSFIFYSMIALKPVLEKYNAEGTVFGSINKNALNELCILIPKEEIITEYESIAKLFDADILKRSEENQKLSTLRDSLLPKLMSGELRINN